ncbi:hypothetical protein GF354_03365 [Candidatus Peregrinibacteria bacterium]|nr:hypothetical protein [Candidatus Peregrinibacteria bacterium]
MKKTFILILTALSLTACATGPDESIDVSTLSDCSELGWGWEKYENNSTSLSFCYKDKWGTPDLQETRISPEAKEGNKWYLIFPNNIENVPQINYATKDFKRLGDSDVPLGPDYSKIDFTLSDEELIPLFYIYDEDETVEIERLKVDDVDVLKVSNTFVDRYTLEDRTVINYFVPNAPIKDKEHNLNVLSSPGMDENIKFMVKTMKF